METITMITLGLAGVKTLTGIVRLWQKSSNSEEEERRRQEEERRRQEEERRRQEEERRRQEEERRRQEEERRRQERIDNIRTLCFITGYIVGLVVLFFLGDVSIIWNFWGWWLILIFPISLVITIISVFAIITSIDGMIGGLQEISAFFAPCISNALVFASVHYLVRWLLV